MAKAMSKTQIDRLGDRLRKGVQSLADLFEHVIVVDRRQQPSHGYRPVHVHYK